MGAYYPEGLAPTKIYIEDQDVRAVRGGTGMAKTGGNYAASLRAGNRAEQKGYTQVLWLDGVHRKYIEEVGAMNVMFKVNGKILTPDLNGCLLYTSQQIAQGVSAVQDILHHDDVLPRDVAGQVLGDLHLAAGGGPAAIRCV